jgi:hypothetical protein
MVLLSDVQQYRRRCRHREMPYPVTESITELNIPRQRRHDHSRKEEMNEKTYPVVSSPRDPRFLTLRSLQTPQGRSRTKLFIIEGTRHLARAVEHCAPIESIFLDPSVLSNPFGQKLGRRLRQHGVPGLRLSRELYRDLTLATEPQGIGAVLKQRWFPLEQIRATQDSFWLAVESIESPGNLGTIIRTAEAAGVSGVFILNPNCDVRSSDDSGYDGIALLAKVGAMLCAGIQVLGKIQRCINCCFFAIWADGLQSTCIPISHCSYSGQREARTFRAAA